MRRLALAAALLSVAFAPALRALDDPPEPEPGPSPEAPAPPAPEAPPAAPAPGSPETPPAAKPAPPPLPPAPPVKPPLKPLSARLDYQRWMEMSERERQTFVEGTVGGMAALAGRLKEEVAKDPRIPPERLAAMVQLIRESMPQRDASAYLREMYTIYLTEEGRKMSMMECFLLAFRRLNAG